MESYPAYTFPSSLNLFEDEEVSSENLKFLLNTPVEYDSSKSIDHWHPSL
jgi:hypothetical protein